MAVYQFHDDTGDPIDAHFEVKSGQLILHSRGGTTGTPNARNTEYGPALRMLLERISRSKLTLDGAWVDSSRVQNLPLDERQILFPQDQEALPDDLYTRLSRKMASVGRSSTAGVSGGNSTKRIRFAFAGNPYDERIVGIVGRGEIVPALSGDGRLPVVELNRVAGDHVWRAVQRLLCEPVKHSFGESTHYDVIADDGSRLPPKAVFGIAASEALGFQVRPCHFKGGIGTPCFKAIAAAGYSIRSKDEPFHPDDVPPNPDDRIWVEGNPKFVTHLRRERGSGIAQAKKRAFKQEHGRLLCEKCCLDPEQVYGPAVGEACIEVHHILPLSEGPIAGGTRIEDLMCVCANCHRIIHHKLRRHADEMGSQKI